jgi:PAS domain S-box-containing protein
MTPQPLTQQRDEEILVVEDSPTQAEQLQYLLREQGYSVTMARNGREALASLHASRPSLILSDVVMPEMDGFDLCRQIKSQPAWKEIPFILLTSLSSPNDIVQGLSSGADNFIRKPYDAKYLLSRIEYVLTHRELRRTEKTQLGVEIYLNGQRHFIAAERQQILDLLISTYEDAVQLNKELQEKQKELAQFARQLESIVEQRTAALTTECAERKRAEAALRESEERYRLLFESNPQPMWVYDTETLAFLAINETAVGHYGFSQEEFLKMKITDLHLPEDIPQLLQQTLKQPDPRLAPVEWQLRRKDGSVIHVEMTSHALPFGNGKSRLVLANDVSERKKLEEQFRQAQKMEAIGQLAGGVAHDFNNLLTIINGYSQLVMERYGSDRGLASHLEQIQHAGDRAAALTRQLLVFSRRQVLTPQVLDLNRVVAGMDTMLRRLIGEDIDLVTVQGPRLGRVRADAGQIEQILLNLAVNARDAMPDGGRLTIETANIELDESYARRHMGVTPGSYVLLAVSDTGQGMDEKIKSHIFEPFFTTKEAGKGTGLGLATVYGIVRQSAGHIWVYSELGRGATFKVYLPRVAEEARAEASTENQAREVGGTETILLVEDEQSLRVLAREILESKGYRVLEAEDARNALRLAADHASLIHLLLTDVVMPELSGKEVADRLKPLHPETKVLYMSGYTDTAIVHHGVLDPGTAYLQKPFTPAGLLRKVREVLGA